MPLRAGSKVGPYEVIAPLGAGGMGEVWRAQDPRLGRSVAIKVLPDDVIGDAARVARFHAEARAASALNHPNIVTVYDIGEDSGRTYLSMELLEGTTLRQLVDGGRPALPKALQIACQIAEGLAAAHARGIVHRDLKPENVILTTDGVVKILDFGLAKLSPLDASLSENDPTLSAADGTTPGTLLGTIGYMAPEQAGGKPVDFHADQFSFGSILYELVSGRRAWRKGSAAETLVAIMRDDPPSLSSVEPPVPPPVQRIIEHCLAKDPQDRYASTRDLAGDVRYAAEHPSQTSWPPDARPAVEVAPPRRIAVRTTLTAALLTALVVLSAGLWLRWRAGPAAIGSLAVLPFDNGTHDPDGDYLSEGITESLIDEMSRVRVLTVMARATVFRYKGSRDPLEVGRKLGVAAVLTGSVARSKSRLTISAELVDVATGARLWGERYERPFADIVRVQNAIAFDILKALRLRLTEREKRALGRHGTENAEAYELFLRGRYFFYKGTEEGYLEAARLFDQAAQKDPNFPEALTLATQTGGVMAMEGYVRPADGWTRQMDGARKALGISPGLPAPRFAIATGTFAYEWNWEVAEREFRQLFEEFPDGEGLDSRVYALFQWSRGRVNEALALMERARRTDPGNLAYAVTTADYLMKAGRLDEAVGLYRAAAVGDPDDSRPLYGLAEALRRKGDLVGAIDALRSAYALTGEDDGVKALAKAQTEKDVEDAQAAVARSQLEELRALAKKRYVSPLDLARLEAQLGRREEAFRYLEEAFAERSGGLVLLKVDSAWDKIRDDARFAALVRRVGIP